MRKHAMQFSTATKLMDAYSQWDIKVKIRIREFTQSVDACRKAMGSVDKPDLFPDVNISERATWPKSADKYANLFELLVYGYSFDVTMKVNLKNRRTVDDFLAHSEVCGLMETVDTLYKSEVAAETVEMEDGDGVTVQVDEELTLERAMSAMLDLNKSTTELLIQHKCNTMPEEARDKVESKAKVAQRDVKAIVTLVPEPKTQDDVATTVQKSTAGLVEAKGTSHTIVVCDGKLLCECGSQGKWRPPPTRLTQLTKMLGGFVVARGGQTLHAHDVIVAPGGKGRDFEDKLLKSIAPAKVDSLKQFATYTYDSVQARQDRDHGGVLELMETCHLLFEEKCGLAIEKRPRKHDGNQNTRGNVIGPLGAPSLLDTDVTWHVPLKVKKLMYGPANLPLPGGPCPESHDKAPKLKQHDLVPAFYHEGSFIFASELNHTLKGAAIIDLTPGSGHWAMVAIRAHIPYLGFCFTQEHVDLLYARLVSRVLAAKLDANDKELYDPSLANTLTQHAENSVTVDPPQVKVDKVTTVTTPTKVTKVTKVTMGGSAGGNEGGSVGGSASGTGGAGGKAGGSASGTGGSAGGTATGSDDVRAGLLARIAAIKAQNAGVQPAPEDNNQGDVD